MRLFYEHPELTLEELTLPFLDARKRVADYPEPTQHREARRHARPPRAPGRRSRPAAVITVGRAKVTLVDYSLVPDVAIVDPTLTVTMPPAHDRRHRHRRADPRARGGGLHLRLALHRRLLRAGRPAHLRRRCPGRTPTATTSTRATDMANAATIAGLAFSNAFVGVNHALAHAVGARFGIAARPGQRDLPAPRAALQRVGLPTKFMPAPGYSAYVAPEKYATLGWILFGGNSEEKRRDRLFTRVDELIDTRRRAPHAEGRGRDPSRSSRPPCPTWRVPPSPTPACAPTPGCR